MNNEVKKFNILGLVGSLRVGSYNKMLMHAVQESLSSRANLEIAEIGNLPLYDQDMEKDFPKVALELKNKIESADAIIITTPEYNRSIPGVLKNAIDWTSRPYASNTWSGKKVLVLGASVGEVGTALAQYHLKQILSYVNAKTLGQPEFYLNMAKNKFNDKGELTDISTKEHVDKAVEALLSELRN